MRQKDVFKTLCCQYYQLQDTLDENQELLDKLKDNSSNAFDLLFNEFEETLEMEREKIIKINCEEFKNLIPAKQTKTIEKIKQLTKVQENLKDKMTGFAESNDSFDGDESKHGRCLISKGSETMCSEEETKENAGELNQHRELKRASTSSLKFPTNFESAYTFNKLPASFSKIKRYQERRLPSSYWNHKRAKA